MTQDNTDNGASWPGKSQYDTEPDRMLRAFIGLVGAGIGFSWLLMGMVGGEFLVVPMVLFMSSLFFTYSQSVAGRKLTSP